MQKYSVVETHLAHMHEHLRKLRKLLEFMGLSEAVDFVFHINSVLNFKTF